MCMRSMLCRTPYMPTQTRCDSDNPSQPKAWPTRPNHTHSEATPTHSETPPTHPVASTVFLALKRCTVPSSMLSAITPRHSSPSISKSSAKYSMKYCVS